MIFIFCLQLYQSDLTQFCGQFSTFVHKAPSCITEIFNAVITWATCLKFQWFLKIWEGHVIELVHNNAFDHKNSQPIQKYIAQNTMNGYKILLHLSHHDFNHSYHIQHSYSIATYFSLGTLECMLSVLVKITYCYYDYYRHSQKCYCQLSEVLTLTTIRKITSLYFAISIQLFCNKTFSAHFCTLFALQATFLKIWIF